MLGETYVWEHAKGTQRLCNGRKAYRIILMSLFGYKIVFLLSERQKKQIASLKYRGESRNFTWSDFVNFHLAWHNQRAALDYCESEMGHVVTHWTKYEKLGYLLNGIYEGVLKYRKCAILADPLDFGRTLQLLLDTSWTSLRALPQLLLVKTVLFMRFLVTVPAAVTGMARAGASQTHMMGVAVEWGYEAGNGSVCKRTLMPAPTLLNIVIVMIAMISSLWLNVNKCDRTIMSVPSMSLPRPPTRWPSPKEPF